MRPAVVITLAILLIAILGAAVLQIFILDPDIGVGPEETGAATMWIVHS